MNLTLWQMIDSGFPSGGFAHSGGLEAAVHHGRVAGDDGVLTFARQTLSQMGRSALPLVGAAHRDRPALQELDRLNDAFLSNPVANRASRTQGRALVTTVARAFSRRAVADIEQAAKSDSFCGHHAPLFGAVFGALEVSLDDTQRAYLFVAVRGVTSAAVRLGVIGAFRAQEIQAMLAADLEQILDRCGHLDAQAIAQTAPLIDLCQSTHDRLYSRLFQS